MKPRLALLAYAALAAPLVCPAAENDLAGQFFEHPDKFVPTAQAVFKTRGYDRAAIGEIPTGIKVYVFGKDPYSRAAFAEIEKTITDPTLKGLNLDNPNHSFSFKYNGACYVKLIEQPSDKRQFIADWTGVPINFLEKDDLSLGGQDLGMSLHEVRHCAQARNVSAVKGETEADMAFARAQAISGDANLLRETMYLRALFVVNSGIDLSHGIYSATDSYYPSALSFDAILRRLRPPNPELAGQAYIALRNDLALLMAHQARNTAGFRNNPPLFIQIALADKCMVTELKARTLSDPVEILELRAAELYLDGLNFFAPRLAESLEERYGRIDFPR